MGKQSECDLIILEGAGFEQGCQAGMRSLFLLLLEHRMSSLSPNLKSQIACLPCDQIELLAIALFNCSDNAELNAWLFQQDI
jgi:Domain of unknown function (DUF4351)